MFALLELEAYQRIQLKYTTAFIQGFQIYLSIFYNQVTHQDQSHIRQCDTSIQGLDSHVVYS